MRYPRLAPLGRFALVCVGVVALAYAVIRPSEDLASRPSAEDPSSPGAVADASVFGPVPNTGSGVVRAPGPLILPITGGGEGAWRVLTPCGRSSVAAGERQVGAHVVLDPGHGGPETGAVSPTGLTEAELNLDIARRVAGRLEAAGATVVLTRHTDIRVALATRRTIVDALDPLLFVSIHHNSGPTSEASRPGSQVYHPEERTESARLGGLIWEELQAALAPFSATWSAGNATGVRVRLNTEGQDFYGLLRDPGDVPRVLVEALYLSAEPESELLLRDDVRSADARAIADAITAWVSTRREGSGFINPLVSDESAGGGGGTEGCVDPPGLGG